MVDRHNRLLQIVCPEGMAGEGVTAVQDARTFVARLDTGTAVEPTFDVAQGAYFYVIEGELGLNDSRLRKRDASYITAPPKGCSKFE